MSPLDQVLSAAKLLSDEGKTPTLALIKTKLGVSVPMPTLIQGLQQYKSMNEADKANIKSASQISASEQETQALTLSDDQRRIANLEQELTSLRSELSAVLKRLSALESATINPSEK